MGWGEQGQGTVEWVGVLCVVGLLMAGLVAVGVRVPGVSLAQAVASRILCAASLADSCGDDPVLIAEYGSEVGRLVRAHMPSLLFEQGSRAVPVDFRRCRSTSCGDGAEHGYVRRTEAGLPVSAFVHVIDCRPDAAEEVEAEGGDCSGSRAGNLYIQYWTYYADSATLRGVPIVGEEGFHPDDWEGVQIRIRPDGSVDERASSHEGYNDARRVANWGSDIGFGPLKAAAEAVGLRPENGWGPETHILLVSGGSHAGSADGIRRISRMTPRNRVHLIPFEPIATSSDAHFAITPPWRKQVWRDPEAQGTN
jgi:hypothetical protein